MKCNKCGSDMRWEGSLRTGGMKCSYCALPLPVVEFEMLNAQVDAYKQLLGVDPAADSAFPSAFYATASGHNVGEDDVQCKRCNWVFAHTRADTFATCPACGYAGWKEYV
jgi:DNA-directed RNA polymerase subunit RPC12/RpoP